MPLPCGRAGGGVRPFICQPFARDECQTLQECVCLPDVMRWEELLVRPASVHGGSRPAAKSHEGGAERGVRSGGVPTPQPKASVRRPVASPRADQSGVLPVLMRDRTAYAMHFCQMPARRCGNGAAVVDASPSSAPFPFFCARVRRRRDARCDRQRAAAGRTVRHARKAAGLGIP
eukprot:gene10285-biopygen22798